MDSARVAELHHDLDALAQTSPHELSDDELLRGTEGLLRAVNRLNGVIAHRLQVMQTRRCTEIECGRQTRSWLVEDEGLSPADAGSRTFIARALPERPVLAAAMLDGDVSTDHARVIVSLLRATPVEIRDVVEKELVDACAYVDPTSLGRFARELKERFGAYEDRDAAEQRKFDGRWLKLTDTFEGMVSLTGMLDPAGAAVLRTSLRPLARKGGEDDTRSVAQRHADALVSLATQALNAGQLPDVAGDRPAVMVTMSYDQLKADLEVAAAAAGAAWAGGAEITAATARMFACDAGIIPAVLGANSEVLDLGRKTPTWSAAQRRALKLETGGGCGWPRCRGAADHAHHIEFWSHGGPTDTRSGIYLCWFHHWLIHHSTWHLTKDPDNTIRTWRE
jgi:hypothetical protein